jgi:hypothetical protein
MIMWSFFYTNGSIAIRYCPESVSRLFEYEHHLILQTYKKLKNSTLQQ